MMTKVQACCEIRRYLKVPGLKARVNTLIGPFPIAKEQLKSLSWVIQEDPYTTLEFVSSREGSRRWIFQGDEDIETSIMLTKSWGRFPAYLSIEVS